MSERYQVLGRVGKGGMSAIYRAYDIVMGREVAVKRLLPVEETRLNEASGESLAREAAALARFQHPNVVTIFAFEEDAEGPFVVMELVEGEDLHAIMKSGPLSWETFSTVAEQCLDPLVAAGELNLLHRDIKPGNLMLTETPSGRYLVKLLDFGLAKFSQQPSLQTLDQQGFFLGSIDFIAPEQLELRPLDSRTDLYSLGCVFYYMLTQKSPFSGANPAETTKNHVRHRCVPIGELRPDLPPLVANWIMRLISRHPSDRPFNARAALEEFHDALAGIPFIPPARTSLEGDDDDDFSLPDLGPVGPPSMDEDDPFATDPVRPPSGPVTRVIKTSSGPVPTVRPATRPVAGEKDAVAQLPGIKKKRRGQGVARRLRYTRYLGPSRLFKKEEENFLSGNGKWLFAGLAGAVILLGVVIFLELDREETPSNETLAAQEAAQAMVELPALLPAPVTLSPADGQPEPPPLPFQNGLFARFTAGKDVYARDYKKGAEPGSQVAAWRNIAPEPKIGPLFRDGGDPHGMHLPVLERFGPETYPALRGITRGLTTTNRTALTASKGEVNLAAGFTLVAVLRLEAGDDRVFRFQPSLWDGRYVQIGTSYDEKVSGINRGTREAKEDRVSLPWQNGTLGLLAYRWDPGAKEHRLSVQPAGSLSASEAKEAVEVFASPVGTIGIGKRGFGDSFDTTTGTILFELILFDRILAAEELKKLMDHLAGRYFR